MYTNKKPANPGVMGDPTSAQDNVSVLYTAHQVHTLAQIIFRQLSSSWPSRAPWTSPAGAAFGQAYALPAFGTGPMAPNPVPWGLPFQASAPPAFFYWYP